MTEDGGAPDRFDQVLSEVVEPVRRFLARRVDSTTADEVAADVLLICWRRREEMPPEPVPWAIGVARNCLRNARRSHRRHDRLTHRIIAVDPPTEAAGPSGDPGHPDRFERPLVAGIEHDDLHHALGGLSDSDAELLRLWAWEQLTAGEIAVVLGVSANAATVRLHRAKQRLRSRLDEVRSR